MIAVRKDAIPAGAGVPGLRTIADLVAGWAERGDAVALVSVDRAGELATASYAELARDVRALAAGLRESGLEDGAPVLLWGPNGRAWVTACFAIVAAGGIVIPLDDQATDEQLQAVLRQSPPQRAFTTRAHCSRLEAAGLAVPCRLLDAGDDDPAGWRSQLSDPASLAPVACAPDRVAALLYTSGTTGTPKGVPLTHENLMCNVRALLAADIITPEDRALLPLPLHHAYPVTVGLLTVLASGASVVLPSGLSGPELTRAIRQARATVLVGVPRLYEVLVETIEAGVRESGPFARRLVPLLLGLSGFARRTADLNLGRLLFRRLHRRIGESLRLLASGGARLEPRLAAKLEALGWTVLTGYGLTETSPVVSFNTPRRRRLASQGLPLAGVEIRIEKRPGEPHGEILVRGPNVFAGYWQDEAATRGAFTADGWFRTRDDGFLDEDGFLHVLGRRSEVIVLADGKKIAPEDLERVYEASPYIRETALLEQQGRLVALIVPDEAALRERGTISVQAVLRDEIDRRAQQLPSYQRIVEFRLARQPLPRTRLGKLRRHLLPELFSAAGAQRPAAAAPGADESLPPSGAARAAWNWLRSRYADRGICLDSSPQLDLGIDSLGWMSLTTELEQRCGVRVSAEALSRVMSVRDLLEAIAAAEEAPPAADADTDARLREAERYLDPPPWPHAILAWTVAMLVRLVLRTVFRLRVEGIEHLPLSGPMVLTPNHTSLLDAPALAAALPTDILRRTCWAGWVGIMHATPLRRAFSRGARIFPVDPDRELGAGLDIGARALERELALVWFPEGRRSADGELQAFRRGIGILLERTRAPAVPVRIRGAWEALPVGKKWPRPRRITVRFGKPAAVEFLRAEGRGEDPASRIADGLERRLRDL
ncbi:MAG TPA: AMP-binding protein [Woeseiaceae bacterium]|nr:AMP-binding protein [Woeseiaceae bacterium]